MAIARSIFTKAVVTGTIFTRARSRSVFGAVPRLIPEDGVSPTVAIGTVTTLAPGSPATVANVGTASAAVFNFGIPEGDQGDPGVVQTVVAGSNISVDNTDPANPVVSSTSAVSSVNGQTGVVVLDAEDIGFTPGGNIAASDVAGAITELDNEKLALSGGTMTGLLTTVASTALSAGFNIPAGTAPSSPVVGDLWQTAAGLLQVRLAGPVTRTFVFLQAANQAFTRAVFFPAGTTTEPSIRLPHGVAPSSPTNGDMWTESATGFWGRVNGTSVNLATVAGVAAAYQPLDSDLTAWAAVNPSSYSTTAQIAAAYQPLDSDLTSWAGVTRASGFDTFAATPSSANLRALLTDETGTGIAYFVGGALGTPSSATLTSATGLPISTGLTGAGTGVLTALGVNVGSAGAFVTLNGALGTPSSGTLTNATGLPIVAGTTGTLTETRGGTNQTTYATGDILYASAANTLAKLAAGVAGYGLQTNGAAAPTWVAKREVLTANRTYYVRTDGSDSNTGLVNSSGGAFLTIQKAADIAAGLDLNAFTVTVEIQTGTYTAGVSMTAPLVGKGSLVFNGNTTTVSITGGTCFRAQYGAKFTVSNLTLTTTTSGNCLSAEAAGSVITIGAGMTFGACAGIHLNADSQGRIDVSANYSVTGAASNHWASGFNGFIVCVGRTITITGTPAFSSAWSNNFDLGLTVAISNTYSGSATGKRYISNTNASTRTSGATFPGNVAGTTDGFGVYT